jgi:DNA-binding transcriptional LysR family regulator
MDLLNHSCINWRQPASREIYKWEFLIDGQWRALAVKGLLVVSHRELAVAAALQGVGIAFWAEARMRPLIEESKLVPLLPEYCGTFPGWFVCYSRHRFVPLVSGLLSNS